jgi:hypothetical protein
MPINRVIMLAPALRNNRLEVDDYATRQDCS